MPSVLHLVADVLDNQGNTETPYAELNTAIFVQHV